MDAYDRLLEPRGLKLNAVISYLNLFEGEDPITCRCSRAGRVRRSVNQCHSSARHYISLRIGDCATDRGCSGLAESRQTSQRADQERAQQKEAELCEKIVSFHRFLQKGLLTSVAKLSRDMTGQMRIGQLPIDHVDHHW